MLGAYRRIFVGVAVDERLDKLQ